MSVPAISSRKLPKEFHKVVARISQRLSNGHKLKIITGAGLQFQEDILSPKVFLKANRSRIRQLVSEGYKRWEAHADLYWDYLDRCRLSNWVDAPGLEYYLLFSLFRDYRRRYADVVVTTNYDVVWDAILNKSMKDNEWVLNPVLNNNKKESEGYYAPRKLQSKRVTYIKIHGTLSHAFASCCSRIYSLPSVVIHRPGERFARQLRASHIHVFDPRQPTFDGKRNAEDCSSGEFFHFTDNGFLSYRGNLLKDQARWSNPRIAFQQEISLAKNLLAVNKRPAGLIVAGFRAGAGEEIARNIEALAKAGTPVLFFLKERQDLSALAKRLMQRQNCYVSTFEPEYHLLALCSTLLDLDPMELTRRYKKDWILTQLFLR